MDALDRILWDWRHGLCTCRYVSESAHNSTCPVGGISDDQLEDLAYDLDEWYHDQLSDEFKKWYEEIHNATNTDQTSDQGTGSTGVHRESQAPAGGNDPQG